MKTGCTPGGDKRNPAHPTKYTDIPVLELASRLWKKLRPVDIRDRLNEISRQYGNAGWKGLSKELLDEILDYLVHDLDALWGCSMTCRRFFAAARPLIHQRLVCLGSRTPEKPKPERSLLSSKRGPGPFEELVDADRSGVLLYTRHLTLKSKYKYYSPRFHPGDIQEYLPRLRSITRLHSLTLETFHLPPFTPVFSEHFGMFANTLRYLDIRDTECATPELLYIICQFPLLDDLVIMSPASGNTVHPGHPVPTITRSPPLRGKLLVSKVLSREFFDGLATLPGGPNFSSLEFSWCKNQEAVVEACNRTATSVSYLWKLNDYDGEPNPPIRVRI